MSSCGGFLEFVQLISLRWECSYEAFLGAKDCWVHQTFLGFLWHKPTPLAMLCCFWDNCIEIHHLVAP
ncbi:hypothetical protein HanIR_Chr01g0022251 [Helianthus annuus]|nr:hypothetical protein HanIR_Chr01g0022251 [Helianthus annuus]